MEKDQNTRSYEDRRHETEDRRHEQDPEYVGPERRSGLDARGEKPIPEDQKVKQPNLNKDLDEGLDWLFDNEDLPKSPKS